jgi:hypothetical protein
MIRIAIATVLVAGCISQAKQVIAPEPTGEGALSCREIVEQCDTQCSDPLCLHGCSNQGHADGAAQHGALLDCGQRNSCTDQECMQTNCPTEIQACMGEPLPDEAPATDAPDPAAPDAPAG